MCQVCLNMYEHSVWDFAGLLRNPVCPDPAWKLSSRRAVCYGGVGSCGVILLISGYHVYGFQDLIIQG